MNYQTLKVFDYVSLIDADIVKILFIADLDKECRVLKRDGTKDSIPFTSIERYANNDEIQVFERMLKSYVSYKPKSKSMKFASKIQEVGIVGLELKLNLVQCQALNKLHSRIEKKYEDIVQQHEGLKEGVKDRFSKYQAPELDTELLTLLADVNQFLKLFEDFPHPDFAKDLWINSDKSPTSKEIAEDITEMNKRFVGVVDKDYRGEHKSELEPLHEVNAKGNHLSEEHY